MKHLKEDKVVIGANVATPIRNGVQSIANNGEFRNFSHAVEALLREALIARGIEIKEHKETKS